MKATKTLTAVTLAAAFMLSPMLVNAHGMHDGSQWQKNTQRMQHKHGHAYASFKQKLDLSQEQKDQLFKLRHAQAEAVYEQKKIINTARKTLRELGNSDKFDAEQAKKITQDLGQAKAQLALLRTQARADFNSVLTAEQKQKLADAKAKWQEKYQDKK